MVRLWWGLTGIVGARDCASISVVYHVGRPALSGFRFSKFVAAHRVVTCGFILVALFWGIAIGACVGVFCY